jgi:hypothetical protein
LNSGQNFGAQYTYGFSATNGGLGQQTQGSIYIDAYAANSSSSYPGIAELYIANYTDSNSNKNILGYGGHNLSSAASDNEIVNFAAGSQNQIGAVTSVTIFRVSGTFIGGSRIAVYGLG